MCVLLAPFVLRSRWHPDTLVLYTWHDPGEHATEAPWTCHSGHWLCPALAPANLTDRKCHRDFQVSSAVAPTATVSCSAGSAMPWSLPDTVLSFRGPHRAPARYHLLCTTPGPATRVPQGSPSAWGTNLITRKFFLLASGDPLIAPTQHPALLRAAGHLCAQPSQSKLPPAPPTLSKTRQATGCGMAGTVLTRAGVINKVEQNASRSRRKLRHMPHLP